MWLHGALLVVNVVIEGCNIYDVVKAPDRKKWSLLKDKYFSKDSSIRYLCSKILEYAQ